MTPDEKTIKNKKMKNLQKNNHALPEYIMPKICPCLAQEIDCEEIHYDLRVFALDM